MFKNCFILAIVNLSYFKTLNVTKIKKYVQRMLFFNNIYLSSFKASKSDTEEMFSGYKKLSSCESFDKNIIDVFNKKQQNLL